MSAASRVVVTAVRRRLHRWSRRIADPDGGSAVVEFVFVGVLVLVPLVYLIVSVATVQRSSLGVTAAAREAGRAFATAESTSDARARAVVAARLAEQNQGLSGGPELTYVPADGNCDAPSIDPQLRPGAVFRICVVHTVRLPGVPSVISGRGIRTVGEYVVHVDDFRAVR